MPQDTKQKGLKQDDFRKLLQTPRPGDASAKGTLGMATPRQRMPPQTPKAGTFSKPEIPSLKAKKSSRFRKTESSEADSNDNKYRDRAAERRKGANPDYQETEQILKALNNSEELEAKLIYEQSKYLGGDTEHTHLVKGLDYALLAKVRSEINRDGEEGKGEKDDEELEAALEKIKEESQETPKINSRLAQNIYDIVIEDPKKKKPPKLNELFVTGRMAYVFELADERGRYGDAFSIPTTVIRSKADINNYASVDKSTNDLVIEKISRVMAYVRKSGGMENKDKKVKKKPKEKQPSEIRNEKVVSIDDSEDIFADSGRDYHVTIEDDKPEEKAEDAILSVSSGIDNTVNNYFGTSTPEVEDDRMDIDKSKEVQKLQSLIKEAAASGVKNKEEGPNTNPTKGSLRPSKGEGIKKRLYGQDSYDADYSAYGLGIDMVAGTRESAYDSGHSDSDSDGTGAEHTIRDQGVTKNKKAQLSKWDFDTEEDWQAYKNNVTAMPKSAFQFGVKTGDGRKTRRSGKELTEKQKLDRDFQKISRIMEQKYGKDENEEGTSRKKQKK
ncbi:15986_t:CDS:2 [Acaulospora colombiana]|uniref:15986_t:CDS:1 n=1 Tax=Acaulospora colombiana TaxID=27376 RepID=A0ACA9LD86_9GLOM|nr:15986_t:CDS:2 [Acaulospora colombiana]